MIGGVFRSEHVPLWWQLDVRRKEARQTHTGDRQSFLSGQARELEDLQTQEVIRKLFQMVEDTMTKSGTRRHQDRSGALPVQIF